MKRTPRVNEKSLDAFQIQAELLKHAPPWRKLELMGRWSESLRLVIMSELRQRHHNKTENELRVLFMERLYGSEIAAEFSKALLESK